MTNENNSVEEITLTPEEEKIESEIVLSEPENEFAAVAMANSTRSSSVQVGPQIFTDLSRNGEICCEGDEEWYLFEPEGNDGWYSFYTTGSVDTIGTLYKADGSVVEGPADDCCGDANFRLTAKLKSGVTYYLKVTAGDSSTGEFTVHVMKEASVQSIKITGSDTLQKRKQTTLVATIEPPTAYQKGITWSSTKTHILTVDPYSGEVFALSAGTASICATAQDGSGVYACHTITVTETTYEPIEETTQEQEKKTEGSCVADPVDVYSGAHVIKNTLMSLFGGQNLKVIAHYDSTKLVDGELGSGWYHNFEKRLEICDCKATVYSSPSVYSVYESVDNCTTFTCNSPNKNGYVLTYSQNQQHPYSINCNGERTEYYDLVGRLARITSHQGFDTYISYNSSTGLITISDSVSGKKIYMEKNSDGKISRIYDDASRLAVLTYTDGCLTGICDVNNNNLTFTYEDGRIKKGIDSNNVCYFENTYDECGRVSKQKDGIAGSRQSEFYYNDDDGSRMTINRNAKESTRVFDENGLLVSLTDENGNTTTYEYDSRFNMTKETDANGNSITREYNSFNKPTRIIDKNGIITRFGYDYFGNLVSITYPDFNGEMRMETFAYNARNQITRHIDLRGTETVYTYDTAGMPLTKKVGDRPAIQYSYENGFLKSVTDAMGNVTGYTYNTLGQLFTVTNAENKITTYEYDNCGNLLKTTDAYGKSVVNVYDGNNQKRFATDANGNTTEYVYNGNMKNETVKFADNNIISYEFDGEDRPTKVIDQAGNETVTTYDDGGRIKTKTFPDEGVFEYQYDNVGNVIKEINPNKAETTKTYDANGNVLTVTDNDGNITRYTYDDMNRVVRAVNAVSGATVYEYSKAGDLLSETDAMGNKKTYTYDAFGNKLTFTDAMGNTTSYTYDANNNLLTVTNALNQTTTYTYDSMNRLKTVTDANNHTVTYGYDDVGRKVTVTDARNNTFTTEYDNNGNITKLLDAKNNVIKTTTYNCLNLPHIVTEASGKITTHTYNSLGKLHIAEDNLSNSQEYLYDKVGRNTQVKNAFDKTSFAEFDTLGNITRLVGPMGGGITYTYDSIGRLETESTSSGGTISYTYNELNVKEEVTNARGQKRKYFYDALGRITGYVGAEDSVSYTYDANGNVLTVTDRLGTITREYDALNRVTSCTDTNGDIIGYTYDNVGNLATLTYPDGSVVRYEYDANNNMVKVYDWWEDELTYTYDVNNNLISIISYAYRLSNTYDDKQRLVSTHSRSELLSYITYTRFNYTYDELGRISTENDVENNRYMCYTYDELSRLKRRVTKDKNGNVLSDESFDYDDAGNIIGDSQDNAFVYDLNNRLTSYQEQNITYDADGNMTGSYLGGQAVALTYDSANRLISAGGNTYTYNAQDVRVSSVCGEDTTVYTYNTNCRLSQLLQKKTNGLVTKYLYGSHGLILQENPDEEYLFYFFDYRGSTVAISDGINFATDKFTYDSYGKVINRTGTNDIIFGYNGRDGVVTDENGLIYMRARYYSPELRRFVNADILHGNISDSTSLNRYAYVNGNPVSFVDPFGLSPERESNEPSAIITAEWEKFLDKYFVGKTTFEVFINNDMRKAFHQSMRNAVLNAKRPNNIGKGTWAKQVAKDLDWIDDVLGKSSPLAKGLKAAPWVGVGLDASIGLYENIQNAQPVQEILTDATLDVGFSALGVGISSAGASLATILATSALSGTAIGTAVPGLGNVIGAVGGLLAGLGYYALTEVVKINGKSATEWLDEWF